MRRVILVLCLLIASCGAVVFVRFNPFSPKNPPPQLPQSSEIDSITAELFGTTMNVQSVPKFDIPAQYVSLILDVLQPVEQSEYPASWDHEPLGAFAIKTKTGRVFEVTYCFSGKNALCFTVDGVRCARGGEYKSITNNADGHWLPECTMLAGIINEIYREQSTGEKTEWLQRSIEDMERSRGARPPR